MVAVDRTDIEFLKTRIDQKVKFHCKDGEVVVGTLHFVSEEDEDVIYDLISSDRLTPYQSHGDCAYRLAFDEIDFVTFPER